MKYVLIILLMSLFASSALDAQEYSLSFDGSNDYVDISYSDFYPSNLCAASFSLEAWIYPHDISGSQTIIALGYNHPDPMLFQLSEGRLQVHTEVGGGNAYFSTDTILSVNTWYHVAWVGEYGNGGTFYLNGAPVGNTPTWTPMQGVTSAIGGGYEGRYFSGKIDNVRIWNKAISDNEVRDNMFIQLNPSQEANLIGYWVFNEGTGTTLTDFTANNHHGTIYGAVWSTDTPIISPSIILSIDSVETTVEENILVPIRVEFPQDYSFSSAEISFGGFQQYGVEFIEVVAGDGLMGSAGWTIQVNETDTLLITGSAGSTDISGGGELFWLNFFIPLTLKTKFIPITIETALFNNGELSVIKNSGGIIHNCIFEYGDVDINGEIRAYDASLILKHLVDYVTLDECQLRNSDVTLDETVSALDASVILMNVVGLIDTLPYDTTSGSLKASGMISMSDGGIQAGDTIDVPLSLSDGDNILSFEGVLKYNPLHLTFKEILWSEQLSDFTIELNDKGGEIIIAGAGSLPDGKEGEFGRIQFIVDENFNDTETFVDLKELRWNEETTQVDVSSAKLSKITSVINGVTDLPNTFNLFQNYPNPFNPSTNISFQLPKSEFVEITVYDITGRYVETIEKDFKKAGHYNVKWNASNLGSGIYFYQIRAGEFTDIKKGILVK